MHHGGIDECSPHYTSLGKSGYQRIYYSRYYPGGFSALGFAKPYGKDSSQIINKNYKCDECYNIKKQRYMVRCCHNLLLGAEARDFLDTIITEDKAATVNFF